MDLVTFWKKHGRKKKITAFLFSIPIQMEAYFLLPLEDGIQITALD